MKNILIINDGTDEMFNMHGIQANSVEDATTQLKELFGDIDGEDLEEINGTDRFFLSIVDPKILEELLTVSNKCNHTDNDIAALESMMNILEVKDDCWGLDAIKKIMSKEENPKGVAKLIKDIRNNVWEFQSESDQEDSQIILGLEKLIKDIKEHKI